MPACCSRPAADISQMMPLTRCTLATTSSMVLPAWVTSRLPAPTFCTQSSIKVLISLAAPAERCASARTSDVTTAKPRPCSPARVASTAAFRARMLVWKAMPSITPMISLEKCKRTAGKSGIMKSLKRLVSEINHGPNIGTSLGWHQ